jgi:hypothetical protein
VFCISSHVFTVADDVQQKLWLNDGEVGLESVEVAEHGNESSAVTFNEDVSRLNLLEKSCALCNDLKQGVSRSDN